MRFLRNSRFALKIVIPTIVMLVAGLVIISQAIVAVSDLQERNRYLVDYYFARLELFSTVRGAVLEAALMNRNIILGQPASEIPAFRKRNYPRGGSVGG